MKIELYSFIQSYVEDGWVEKLTSADCSTFTKGSFLVNVWHDGVVNIFEFTPHNTTCIGIYDIYAAQFEKDYALQPAIAKLCIPFLRHE